MILSVRLGCAMGTKERNIILATAATAAVGYAVRYLRQNPEAASEAAKAMVVQALSVFVNYPYRRDGGILPYTDRTLPSGVIKGLHLNIAETIAEYAAFDGSYWEDFKPSSEHIEKHGILEIAMRPSALDGLWFQRTLEGSSIQTGSYEYRDSKPVIRVLGEENTLVGVHHYSGPSYLRRLMQS